MDGEKTLKAFVARARSKYPDRRQKLGVLDLVKLTVIDFGFLFLGWFIYALWNLHWSGPKIIFETDLKIFGRLLVALPIQSFIIEIFIYFLCRIRAKTG